MKKIFIILLLATTVGYSQTIVNYNRYLRSNFGSQTMWDGVTLDIYGIAPMLSANPVITAPTIYCNEGDSVVINALSISQLHHHTIHLHGLDVDTRNDGDPATSFELHHMEDTTYSFKANYAGTYIYHCHVGDVAHVQMGMYGSVIVRAAGGINTAWTGGPGFDKEYNFLTSEIDRSWHDTVPVHDTSSNTVTIPPYLPDYFLVNGKSEWQLDADSSLRVDGAQGEFIYLRLSNIGFYDNKYTFPPSLQAQIIDSDGRSLPVAYNSDTLYVSPGERYGVMLNPNAQLIDSIALDYLNLNTGIVANTQYIDVNIIGYIGLENVLSNDFKVFPNPAKDLIYVELDEELIDGTIAITNAEGKKCWNQKITHQTEIINVSQLSAGVYFVSISTPSNKVTKRIIIQ
jgi:FtsP/CotA-like multicopper oxidase with cupredoxin domain